MSYYIDQRYWYKINFDLIWELFPNTIFDLVNCKWFQIPYFPLPENWLQNSTDLLVILPGLKGDIQYSKPDGFYLKKGLRTNTHKSPEHIYEEPGFNDRSHQNWSRYSFHLKEWSPESDVYSGDTLVTILEAMTIGLFVLAEETNTGVTYE